ncbi:MAG: TetR/AcrR family transcriptional regulator [Acidimicrobiales bacterium]
MPLDPSGEATADEVTARILEAASAIFAMQGPDAVTIKWICREAEVTPDMVFARWPDVLSVLGAVLDDIADQFERLALLPASAHNALTRVALTDRYQRIVARALLDGVNPAALQQHFPVIEALVARGVSERGVDERSARYRVSQIYALEWGWRLFGSHLLRICGLDEDSGEDHSAQLLALEESISWLPPMLPPLDRAGPTDA